MLQRSDLGQSAVGTQAPGKFKVIAVRLFADRRKRRLQQRCQFMVAGSLLSGECRHVAYERDRNAHLLKRLTGLLSLQPRLRHYFRTQFTQQAVNLINHRLRLR